MPRDQETSIGHDPATSDDPLFRDRDDQPGDDQLRGHGDPLRDPVADDTGGSVDESPATGDSPIGDELSAGRHAAADPGPADTPGEWVAGPKGPGHVPGEDTTVVPEQPGQPSVESADPVTGDPVASDTAPDLRATRDTEVTRASEVTPDTGIAVQTAAGTAADTPETPVAGAPGTGTSTGVEAASAALVTNGDQLHDDWARIQSSFVDDPHGSVSQAADLVAQVTSTLVTAVQERERTLRGAWDSQRGADTENLRNALRDYRAFFELLIKL
jgi:hypothetical protein